MSYLNKNIPISRQKNPPSSNEEEKYVLSLYISGITTRSIHAIQQLRKICEEYLDGQYNVKIIDVSRNPEVAESEQITAVPTLIKKIPPPLRKVIGDLSDTEKVLMGLNIIPD